MDPVNSGSDETSTAAGADTFERAVEFYRGGQAARAEAICRALIAKQPDHAPALYLLGTIRSAAGQSGDAIALLELAVAAQPDYVEAQFTLGNMLAGAGRFQDAATCYAKVAALRPQHPHPFLRLGAMFVVLGQWADAEPALRRGVTLQPENAAAAAELTMVLVRLGKLDEAVRYGHRAAALAPDDAGIHLRLGLALKGRFQARAGSDAAAALRDLADAETSLRRALQLQPADGAALTELVEVLRRQQRLIEAVELCEAATARTPDFFEAFVALASLLATMGEMERCLAAATAAQRLRPDDSTPGRQLLLYMELAEGITPEQVLAEARAWQDRFSAPLLRSAAPHPKPSSKPRLRVGYLGGGLLHATSAMKNLWPLIEAHDRQTFEIFCYSDLPADREDGFSKKLQALCTWRRSGHLDDAGLADLIRQDGIDILVDVPQFFPGSRMLALARRPAPVQIAFPLNATLGGGPIDYVIADPHLVPPGAERCFGETVLRVPLAHLHRGFEEPPPPTERPPSLNTGQVTFGSFNWLAKICPTNLGAWARILSAVPRSRLLIKCEALQDAQLKARFLQRFASLGIDAGRIDVRPLTPTYRDHLALHNEVDVILDTFPYNGGTTTCDALLMGAPVVTLVGEKVLDRYGLMLLACAGFEVGTTYSVDAYVETACKLAADPAGLAAQRLALRDRFRQSPVCAGDSVARSIEAAYLEAWQRHVTGP